MEWLLGILAVWVALLTWRVFRLEQAARHAAAARKELGAALVQRIAARGAGVSPGREALRARLARHAMKAG